MIKNIILTKLDNIDNTYSHVMDFASSSARHDYFTSKYIKTFSINVRDDGLINQITLPVPHNEINFLNYLYMYDETGSQLFFFILSYEHTTQSNTTLNLQLDVWTTYQFQITFLDSFVDRCHVPRWNGDIPTQNTIDEGLPINEYILDSTQIITSYKDGLIISSTQPLGVCDGFNLPSTGGGGSTGEPSDGSPTKTGFRFIKGYEGFAPLGLYLNNENFKTVGYGSTESANKTYYDMHKPFPCTEQKASVIFAERYVKDFGELIWNECVKCGIDKEITKQKLDAMTSVAYNCGFYGFTQWSSSPWHLIKINPNDPNIRDKWLKFAITGGNPPVELEGLKLRRIAESNIYFDNLYEFRSILKYKDNGSGVGVSDGVVTDNRGDGYIPDFLPDLTPQIEIILQ